MILQNFCNRTPFTQRLETSWKSSQVSKIGKMKRVVDAILIDMADVIVLHLFRTFPTSSPECFNYWLIQPQPVSLIINNATPFFRVFPSSLRVNNLNSLVYEFRDPP